MKNMSKAHLKPRARLLFDMNWTQKDIAEFIGVSEQIMSKWVNNGNWKEERDSKIENPLKTQELILGAFQREFREAYEKDELDASNVDRLTKMAAMVSKFGGLDDFASSAVLVQSKFSQFCMSRGEWSEEKRNHVLEGIREFMDWVNDNAF